MKRNILQEHGFTLIELLIVIFIIAILTGLAMTNFLGARERARDSKKKAELTQVKTALRLYYNDYGKYPAFYSSSHTVNGVTYFNGIKGCGINGDENCPKAGCAIEFAAGGSSCGDTNYMKKIPYYTTGTMLYYQLAGGDDFLLKALLENKADPDAAVSKQRCPGSGSYICGTGDYCVCAD